MSENIPESIPTSADPRSKRPLKRRAISPRSETASQIHKLMSAPERKISETAAPVVKVSGTVPEIVQNVQGSSAGAGSGEFHVYKASRRREYERLKGMDEEVRRETEAEEWEREKREREEKDAEKTRKAREKRERKRQKKGDKSDTSGAGGAGGAGAQAGKIKPRIDANVRVDDKNEDAGIEVVGEGQAQVGVIIHDDD
ncbi:hypothetical protein SS1G_05735 [Sclerotinia sclerotiorum 1980 UF-70]|uniref:DUF1168 domain protein n=2 Tax=Sclerotinia sclerotiorum (strain ATCC 18683 / 1980 / Ss-1) TaxID=665079 RepID=A7EK89_SCLS1|nr:hypothetical protein SS1G_05735 [Sclerotinia sclerotiorum 1980 UF-70]APA09991.1 hypothetical protein sscle_05g047610 [Sclerotinia sclerotiorum 1980 UF-70]EDO03255.1 hypothetical protein SS1G_05735 [Sclerotinia sclerotiorum 1980 UF-70]